jgi:PHD/YefM family antitoxin component YafN of YafNO toxin-antitoxin module
MKRTNPQYITDTAGKKISVVISMKEYEKIIDELEELEDIRLYDEVKAKKEKGIPFEEYLEKRKKNGHA